MGFAIGYLPFALYYDEHKAFFKSTVMVEEYFWPELFTDNHTGQVMIAFAFLIALILLFRYLVKKGAKDTSTSSASIINKNTEELQFEIDRIKL
ncbi:MAG: hypothetical protein GY936_13030 [Ignavibacteriae bacterium]|nr:hypothetical protein [Ignavibacteriota bacterium]